MQISLDTGSGSYTIRSYSAGEIKINDSLYTQSLIVTPTQLIHPWRPTALSELQATDFDEIFTMNPEVVLLGTGESIQFPSPLFLRLFLDRGIGIEFMDTGAACRTFNVLISESRPAVAALLIK